MRFVGGRRVRWSRAQWKKVQSCEWVLRDNRTMQPSEAELAAYHELCAYTLTHHVDEFAHQYVVDAFRLQHATPETKPMSIAFALLSLYLHVERGVSGREVQRIHMRLAQRKREWPRFSLPGASARIRVGDVLTAPEGDARRVKIDEWCADVWRTWSHTREGVIALLAEHGVS